MQGYLLQGMSSTPDANRSVGGAHYVTISPREPDGHVSELLLENRRST